MGDGSDSGACFKVRSDRSSSTPDVNADPSDFCWCPQQEQGQVCGCSSRARFSPEKKGASQRSAISPSMMDCWEDVKRTTEVYVNYRSFFAGTAWFTVEGQYAHLIKIRRNRMRN